MVTPWFESDRTYPSLEGNLETGVTIVGAGIVGTALAYYLSKRGEDVTLIDKSRVGGSSAKAGGMLGAQDLEISDLADKLGTRKALFLYRENLRTLEGLPDLAYSLGISSQMGTGAIGLVMNKEKDIEGNMEFLNDEANFRRAHKLPLATVVEGSNLLDLIDSPNAIGGIVYHGDWRTIDPAELVAALAREAKANGANVFEITPSSGIHVNRNRAVTFTPSGIIYSRKAVGATQGVNLDGRFSTFVKPFYSVMIATEPLDEKTRSAIGLQNLEGAWNITDNIHGYHYLRPTQDGRIAIGGPDIPTSVRHVINQRPDDLKARYRNIENYLHYILPQTQGVKIDRSWYALNCSSPDELPVIEFRGNFMRVHSVTDTGFVNALTIASHMADAILNGKTDQYLNAVDAKRFT